MRDSRVSLGVICGLLCWPGAGLAGGVAPTEGPAPGEAPAIASPQRPSVSFGTATVPRGLWEVEAGGLVADGGSALSTFVKYGWTARTEWELGLDLVRQAEGPGGTHSSVGDLFVGLRSRIWEGGPRSGAVVGWVKVPTAVDGVGTGEFDVGAVGVFSTPLGEFGLDTNLWLSALGREDGSTLGQVQAVGTLGRSIGGCWSAFAELALQRTATEGDGIFVDAGLACALSRTLVFDAAAGKGWSDGYPDWSLTLGWTFLFDSPRPARRPAGATSEQQR